MEKVTVSNRVPPVDRQSKAPEGGWRSLTAEEITALKTNGNVASDWNSVLVSGEFDPARIWNSRFHGLVRIGRMSGEMLTSGDLSLPVGIVGSFLDSCDIGDDCAIHDVHRISGYVIGDRCILFNVDELVSTGVAPLDGIRIEVMNEAGCRPVTPFAGIIPADAYLQAKYIDDREMLERLAGITETVNRAGRGCSGTVGESGVIRNAGFIKDAEIGPCCHIHGVSRLENLAVMSSEDEPVEIGENAVLSGGVVGGGSSVGCNCIAERFIIGQNCKLKYGVRVIDTMIGDNSTVACCEMLNNLVFPAHEQHHNNSFLIASCIGGQSNLAAGATVGSNHNSRTSDNEIVAGRGFWPGLCVSLKHSSVFASYTLIAKGAYPSELNIPLPFSLVSNNEKSGELEVMPAFWWMYNMYALARNNWKYKARDRRRRIVQNIEFGAFAPDTMQEVLDARRLLEEWYDGDLRTADAAVADKAGMYGVGMEKGRRNVRILKPGSAYAAYGDMIVHYAVMNALEYLGNHPDATLLSLPGSHADMGRWVNLGGQLMREEDADALRCDVREGRLRSWDDVHARYDSLWERYPEDRLRHSIASLCLMMGVERLSAVGWKSVLTEERRIQGYICSQVRESRRKDYVNPFRLATYRNEAEMLAAVGPLDGDSFILRVEAETEANLARIDGIMSTI